MTVFNKPPEYPGKVEMKLLLIPATLWGSHTHTEALIILSAQFGISQCQAAGATLLQTTLYSCSCISKGSPSQQLRRAESEGTYFDSLDVNCGYKPVFDCEFHMAFSARYQFQNPLFFGKQQQPMTLQPTRLKKEDSGKAGLLGSWVALCILKN